ncbi:MAG: LytTR family transcriptional regulator DNA-binding domain-containing protein [Methanococcaceae archaeon]
MDNFIDKLQEILNPRKFFRINRKLHVNFDLIKTIVSYSKSMIFVELIPCPPHEIEALASVERTTNFREWMDP